MRENAFLGLVTIEIRVEKLYQLTKKGSALGISRYYKEMSDLANLWLAIGMDR